MSNKEQKSIISEFDNSEYDYDCDIGVFANNLKRQYSSLKMDGDGNDTVNDKMLLEIASVKAVALKIAYDVAKSLNYNVVSSYKYKGIFTVSGNAEVFKQSLSNALHHFNIDVVLSPEYDYVMLYKRRIIKCNAIGNLKEMCNSIEFPESLIEINVFA